MGHMSLLNKIVCGDAEVVLRNIPDASVDLVITSPPYNFAMKYDEHNDNVDWPSYYAKLNVVWNECARTLKDGGRIAINVQPNYKLYHPTHHTITTYFREQGFFWRGEIVWVKAHLSKLTAWGSWKSPSCPYLSYPFEFIEVFSKTTLKHAGDSANADITKDEFVRSVNGLWNVAPEREMKSFGHPAMFPKELVYRLIKLFSYRGDVVMDPFNGVGTTTLVSAETGRSYIGIDVSETYCQIAEQRIAAIPLSLFA